MTVSPSSSRSRIRPSRSGQDDGATAVQRRVAVAPAEATGEDRRLRRGLDDGSRAAPRFGPVRGARLLREPAPAGQLERAARESIEGMIERRCRDLWERAKVPILRLVFRDSRVLITGGSGSWGTALTMALLEQWSPREIRVYFRSEAPQVLLRRQLSDDHRVRFIIGDVRDLQRLTEAAQGVDFIFHLAALKHVPVCEENPFEAVKTNVLGTQAVVDAAIACGVKWVLDISSDKAAGPLNLYGTTKSVGEKLMIAANITSRPRSCACVPATFSALPAASCRSFAVSSCTGT